MPRIIVKSKFSLEICVVAFNKIKDSRIDKLIINANPKDFISLVDGSSCVITNSFHGAVFSLIFDKPQIVLGKTMYNSRMISLLEKSGRMGHFLPIDEMIDEKKIINIVADSCDSTMSDKPLNDWIAESKDFLLSALE